MLHVVRVGGRDGFPGVPGRVGCRKTERGQQPLFPVGPVVGQGLPGHGVVAAPGAGPKVVTSTRTRRCQASCAAVDDASYEGLGDA
jgi:hypothetical protein